ncbi:unnamed protein product [Pleuronectes platessa]|uniref:Uncharacterized protein n=1 Tax=Pleuronectes platessa TaxID=8262 RepID=A0A9N7V2K4_PLEPL|nr:unnamed protein product [Pleuronectes platessa]
MCATLILPASPHFSEATSDVSRPSEGAAETSAEAECRGNPLQGPSRAAEQQRTAGLGRCMPGQPNGLKFKTRVRSGIRELGELIFRLFAPGINWKLVLMGCCSYTNSDSLSSTCQIRPRGIAPAKRGVKSESENISSVGPTAESGGDEATRLRTAAGSVESGQGGPAVTNMETRRGKTEQARLPGIQQSNLLFPSNPSHRGLRIYGQVLAPETEAERSLPGPSLKPGTLLFDTPPHFVSSVDTFSTAGLMPLTALPDTHSSAPAQSPGATARLFIVPSDWV